MKIKFKNNVLEAAVELPEKPSQITERIFAQQERILADGAIMEGPEFDGMPSVAEESSEPVTHPDIRISQQIDGIEDTDSIFKMFYDSSNYETLEIEDEETQETRTFTNIELGGIQYIPSKFAWDPDGKGGFKKPIEIHHVEISLRGDEIEEL